jgi:long-subunit acyl-CoA synthetase (AMP-forming)
MADTVIAALRATARKHPARTAYAHKEAGHWRETAWAEYHELVRRTARGLMALGVGPGRNLAILSSNRPEWFLASLGTVAAGALPAGIYTTSAPEQCEYIARHCEAAVVVVENGARLQTFLECRERLPLLRAIVLLDGASTAAGVFSWGELLRRGETVAEDALDARIAALAPEACASLIYTSGTTGPPKAVMTSHGNVLWVARAVVRILEVTPEDRGLCYLPLSHVAEQNLSLFGPLVAAAPPILPRASRRHRTIFARFGRRCSLECRAYGRRCRRRSWPESPRPARDDGASSSGRGMWLCVPAMRRSAEKDLPWAWSSLEPWSSGRCAAAWAWIARGSASFPLRP